MRIIEWYQKHILFYNLLLAAIIVGILEKTNSLSVLSELSDTFFGTLAGIFVSILGFSMAAVSILIAVIHGINEENEKIELVRSSQWYGKIYDMYLYTILFSGISAGLSVLSMKSNSIEVRVLWVYSSLLSTMYLCLSIIILKLIISLLTHTHNNSKENTESKNNHEKIKNKIKEWFIR
ncbi:hypothetical protein [Thermococcus sp. ES12]|uniref:hypothetical protein n=1 Tax=Thermococcus sp. ES12 TaxID=1638246 RepID=UPI00142F3FC7|nr:hypothetical protein [Thermococcus sp. ES12]NJE76927.1 hypothetical protein [Thermococcus sp. ES12]